MKCLPISKQAQITDIPQMPTQNILKKTACMDTYPHENSQEKQKNTILPKNSSQKTISPMIMK